MDFCNTLIGRTLTQRKALVTGASGGVGTAIADRLRRASMKVLTLDIAGEVDVKLDIVSDPLPAEIFDHVDVCVSNAGIVDTISPAHTMSAAQWQRDIDVNLTGAFRTMQACLPGMRERGYGRIVAISSVAGKNGLAGQVAYAASKAGLGGAVKSIAIENISHGITANCVLPGFVLTPKVEALPAHTSERLLAAIPMGRFGRTEEIADLVAYLGGETSGYITGQEIAIDGGLTFNTLTIGSGRAR